MPVTADEKDGILEWLASFGYGKAETFRDLGDGAIFMKIISKLCGHVVADLVDMKKTLYTIVTHRKNDVVNLDMTQFSHSEDVIYQVLELIVVAVIDSPDKNEYVGKILRLSAKTQGVMMTIMKRVMGMNTSKPKGSVNANMEEFDKLEGECKRWKSMYEERGSELSDVKSQVKAMQDKIRIDAHGQEELLAESHQKLESV